MTPQTRLAIAGAVAFAVAKLYFKTDTIKAATIGLATVSALAIITWPDTTPNP